MAKIKIDLDNIPYDGMDIVFRTPCDCSQVTGIIIHYPQLDGTNGNKELVLKDAHNNNVGDLSELFASGVLIKILLDITNGYAYIQNADTNQYLENKIGIESEEHPGCFYRIIDDTEEWINPPMIADIEYRTTERYDGKPVYVLRISSQMPNANSSKDIPIAGHSDSHGIHIVGFEGYLCNHREADRGFYYWDKFPVINRSGGIEAVANIYSGSADGSAFDWFLTIINLSNETGQDQYADFIIKYVY